MPGENLLTPRGAIPADVGRAVRTERERRGMSQAALAAAAGVGRRTLQRIEAGSLPSAETVWSLELALGLSPGTLVPGWDASGSPHAGAVGARIRARRRAVGYSLQEVADWVRKEARLTRGETVRMSVARLSRFERGIPPSDEDDPLIAPELVRLLGFKGEEHFLDWLAGRVPDPPTSYA